LAAAWQFWVSACSTGKIRRGFIQVKILKLCCFFIQSLKEEIMTEYPEPSPEVINIPSAQPPAQTGGKSNRTIWIVVIVAAVLLILCCCCVLAPAGLLIYNGEGIEKNFEWELSSWLPTLVQWM
jgi:hypothetical protein